jgi:hypothetical protein
VLIATPTIGNTINQQKIVCSITINSDDEIKTFRSQLPSDQFIFRELVTSDKDWLKKACEQGVRCDLVIMSGHFGGSFFGTNGYLSLEDMEAASCDPKCDGIFHNATEVYMYGCNTLAGKNKDRRSPEEYIATLREDGYSMGEAQRIAAFLYSPFGEAFYSRMSKVYSSIPRIYGFDGKAPLGQAVRPRVASYLRQAAPLFYQALNNKNTQENKVYTNAMSKTNSTQIAGDTNEDEYPTCFINNSAHSQTSKIRWLHDRIIEETEQNRFDSIPLAQNYFRSLTEKQIPFSHSDLMYMNSLKENSQVHQAISSLKSKLGAMPTVAFQISQFENIMQWMSNAEFSRVKVKTLIGSDSKYYSSGQKDFICSLNVSIDVSLNEIPQPFLNQENFIWALACAKPTDLQIQRTLSEYLIRAPKGAALNEVAHFLAYAKVDDQIINYNLLKAYQTQPNDSSKWFIMHTMRSIPVSDPQILNAIADELLRVRDSNLGSVLIDAIGKGAPENPEIQFKVINAFINLLNNPRDYKIESNDKSSYANTFAYGINVLRPTHPQVRAAIMQIINSYPLSDRQKSDLNLALSGSPKPSELKAQSDKNLNFMDIF